MAPPKKQGKVATSTKYFREHPEARAKKAATDKKINARPEQIKKRVEAGRKRTAAKAAGKDVSGKDYDHASNRFISSSANRGKKGEGGRKRK